MASTWGINSESGFYRPNAAEVLEEAQEDLRNTFGNELNMGDNSFATMLTKVQSGREFKVWQQLEATFNSQTRNGAEGIFKDEMYAYQGITRNGKTFGTGKVIVETDMLLSDDIATIAIGATSSSLLGVQYISETTRTMSDFVRGYKIDSATLVVGSYTFTVTNSANLTSVTTKALVSNSDVDRLIFFNNLKTFFETALPDDVASILVDETAGKTALYVGFGFGDGEYFLKGTDKVFKLKFTGNRIGKRFSETAVIAVEKGYNPLPTGSIESILPTPTGFLSVTNIDQFFSGADIETDTAFSIRAEQQSDAPNSGTRPAILSALLELTEVVGADLDKVIDVGTGLVTVEPILFGGTTAEIAQVLYDTQPINNQYIGDISYVVTTEDGKTETIKFSRGVDLNMSIRVEYKPLNGIPLSEDELLAIEEAIEDVNGNIPVGGTVFNGQLEGAVFNVNPKRFIKLTVKIKLETDLDTEYSAEDYIPAARELPTLSASRVEIIQVT